MQKGRSLDTNSIKNILVIGDGVAAWCVKYGLEKLENNKVTHCYDQSVTPCSLRTTSINCLRGTTKGHSALGDLIVDSMSCFHDFYIEENPDGVHLGKEVQFWNSPSQFDKRYGRAVKTLDSEFYRTWVKGMDYYHENDAFFIDPVKLKAWFAKNSQAIIKNAKVTKITKEKQVFFSNGSDATYDAIYICTGHKTGDIAHGLNEEFDYYLDHCKPVAGTYLEISLNDCDFEFPENINFVLNKNHFIYRKDQQVLQIGSTSNNKSDSLLPAAEIEEIYLFLKEHMQLNIPSRKQFNEQVGIRFKGHKRLPYWGEIAPEVFTITGLYKNAFSFAFLAVEQIKREFWKK